MDPITAAIIAALGAGAIGGVTDAAGDAIRDGYSALKSLISRKFGGKSEVSDAIEKLEKKPESVGRRQMLFEELEATNALEDPELLNAARSLSQLIKALPKGEQHIQNAIGTGIAQADRGGVAEVNLAPRPTAKDDD